MIHDDNFHRARIFDEVPDEIEADEVHEVWGGMVAVTIAVVCLALWALTLAGLLAAFFLL